MCNSFNGTKIAPLLITSLFFVVCATDTRAEPTAISQSQLKDKLEHLQSEINTIRSSIDNMQKYIDELKNISAPLNTSKDQMTINNSNGGSSLFHDLIGSWISDTSNLSINIDNYGRVSSSSDIGSGRISVLQKHGLNISISERTTTCSYNVSVTPDTHGSLWDLVEGNSDKCIHGSFHRTN